MTQTVYIPENRQLTIEIPREIPTGKAQFEFKVIPFVNKEEKREETGATPHTDKLLSLLSNIGDVNVDEIRDERLAKHLSSL